PQTPFGNQSTAVDVASQFASTNRSYHPVLARANNSYTMGSRMAAPWNAITKTNTATNQWGALMSCWDCHAPASVNIPAGTNTLLTSTVTAHGSNITAVAGSLNSVELRGVDWSTISGSTVNNTTFCIACHAGYNTATSTGSHGTGSAVGANTSSQMTSWFKNGCTYCHSTSPDGRTDANGVPLSANGVQRRARSADVHGFNTYYGHTTPIAPIAPDVAGTTVMTVHSSLGYAFIRNPNMAVRPLSVYVNGQTMTFKGKTGTTPSSGTAGCSFAPMPTFNVTGGSTSCSNSSMGSATGAGTAFTPGGVY
ncbi:MAG: hypothetical protein FWD78_17610, partial [Treponema sp.]|nr:hypothetical protein [Treponema sp.]